MNCQGGQEPCAANPSETAQLQYQPSRESTLLPDSVQWFDCPLAGDHQGRHRPTITPLEQGLEPLYESSGVVPVKAECIRRADLQASGASPAATDVHSGRGTG